MMLFIMIAEEVLCAFLEGMYDNHYHHPLWEG